MTKFYLFVSAFLIGNLSFAQSFSNSTSSINGFYNSGACTGVVDMDQDGLDDIVVLHDSRELHIYYQQIGGSFLDVNYGMVSGDNQWGMCVGDIDNNGHNDVFSGGAYDGVHMTMITSVGNATMFDLDNGSMFMQGCNISDINNDGWLDAFGCHDDGVSRTWVNDGAGNLSWTDQLIDLTNYDYSAYPNTDHSGNYGSVWTDFDRDGDTDLFIAKCRQFVNDDPMDPRRVNQLWVNNGPGDYSEEALPRGLVPYEQSWTVDFADIDNDGDFDCLLTNHSTTLQIFENINGQFSNITAGSGLEITGFFLQAKMVDFDNDGFVDLQIAGGIDRCYHNNGDHTFTLVENAFPYNDVMHSFGIGDLNNDGFLDLYASYGDGYVNSDALNDDILWMNDGNTNNWIGFNLEGLESNKNAIGAVVEIQGDFGVQVREVRAGESYGIVNSFKINFGLGNSTSVDQVLVYWPSGTTTVLQSPVINEYTYVLESDCVISDVVIEASGSTSLCDGETVTLTAPIGYDYQWNNGEITQSIVVAESGLYSVVIWDNTDGNCAGVSNGIVVEVILPEIPQIEVNGDVEFCDGGSVTLLSSPGATYLWSSGQDTQAITVSEAGDYYVEVTDICTSAISSEVVSVAVLDTPANPVVDNVSIDVPGTVTFTGAGDSYRWYDSETAETPLFEGMEFTTPWLNTTTSFWVEDVIYHGGFPASGGELNKSTEGQYQSNNNYFMYFDALQDMDILSVKVYAENNTVQEIGVFDAFNNLVVSGSYNIPSGENVIELNLTVPEGTDYSLRPMNDAPFLWRDHSNTDLPYPYQLGDVATITGTNVTSADWNNYYYYFYDWQVQTALKPCASARLEVVATVVGIENQELFSNLDIYPNPNSGLLHVNFTLSTPEKVLVTLFDAVGKQVLSETRTAVSGASTNIRWDVTSLSAGIYFIELNAAGQKTTRKVIVQ